MDGYQAILGDLLKASQDFKTESTRFEGLMPDAGPHCPDTGDGATSNILGLALEALGSLHKVLADAVSAHAGKLEYAHNTYKAADVDAASKINGLLDYIYRSPAPTN